MFDVDWKLLVTRLLPTYFRKTFWVVWLNTLLSPLQTLYHSFLAFRISRMHQAGTNSQTLILESRLQDDFGKELGAKIRIRNNSEIPFTVFYPFALFEPNAIPKPKIYPNEPPAGVYDNPTIKKPIIYKFGAYQDIVDGQDTDFVVEVPLSLFPKPADLPVDLLNNVTNDNIAVNVAMNNTVSLRADDDQANFDFVANMNAIVNKHKLLNRNHAIQVVAFTDNTDREVDLSDGSGKFFMIQS
ncbi:MAG: hypothetical protein ACPGJS_05495 [Flammeovirgaceae bacterium]